MAYRYYSTLRPLMVGGIPFPKQPGESITTIVNFEEGRTYCKDIDRPAWGYIEYTAPLDPKQVSDYELVQAPQEADHELVNITKIVWDKLDRLKDNLDKEAAKQEGCKDDTPEC